MFLGRFRSHLFNVRAGVLVLLLASIVASPASAADKCIASLTYQQKGGDLAKLAMPEDVPDEVESCGPRACRVDADIKLVIEKDGTVAVEDMNMVDNTGASTDDRSARMRAWLEALRFDPPKLGVDPVCVRMEWSFWFAKTAPKNTRLPPP